MFKKSLLSIAIAALLMSASLFGCAPAGSSSASSSSSAAASSSASSSAQASDEASDIEVFVRIDSDLLEGTAEAEGLAAYGEQRQYEVAADATAYDALVATGVEVDGSPSYVTSINGVGEGLAGSASGWMYMVNDEIPTVAADEYALEAGDVVIWYYGSWS